MAKDSKLYYQAIDFHHKTWKDSSMNFIQVDKKQVLFIWQLNNTII